MMTAAQSRILFYAFRYCLGRMTNVTSDFCEYVVAHVKEILTTVLLTMDKEITEAQEHDDKPENAKNYREIRLGLRMNRADWLGLRGVIREELKRRKSKEKTND